MDIAKAFEILSQGKIISVNSSKYIELSNMLLNDNFYEELNIILNTIGYKLNSEDGYYFISKKSNLTSTEQQLFLQNNKNIILAISFFRQLYPRLDRGSAISFLHTAGDYSNMKSENDSLKKILLFLFKNKDDEKELLEQLFKFLEDKNIIEKENENNSDKYKVLNSISYYISIVELVEKGENENA
ncbi:hypothetical protein HUX57_11305 [Arcobacter butzleri]|uniref:hypothetical protein n=1 Tax=Aliarcobacter butzleri TaxID=28197 RepID=UPI0015878B7A|nr:hypothetical protein [Aliarcobacter butzleri]NUW27243.1 hypothetical protein [Aliarcobacter butzleri]